jgi:hypothetical protein
MEDYSNRIELRIVRKVITALKNNGTPVVKVYDTEEYVPVTNATEAIEATFAVDEAFLMTATGSWVRITLGNEWDVITDYTTDLEDALQPVSDYIDKYGE